MGERDDGKGERPGLDSIYEERLERLDDAAQATSQGIRTHVEAIEVALDELVKGDLKAYSVTVVKRKIDDGLKGLLAYAHRLDKERPGGGS